MNILLFIVVSLLILYVYVKIYLKLIHGSILNKLLLIVLGVSLMLFYMNIFNPENDLYFISEAIGQIDNSLEQRYLEYFSGFLIFMYALGVPFYSAITKK